MANEKEAKDGLFDEIVGPGNENNSIPKMDEVSDETHRVAGLNAGLEGEELDETEETEEVETEEQKSEDKSKDDGCDPKVLENAKKELGIGGAAFCDELFSVCPSVFQRLKDAKKTLHGFFNYAYSYALDEYVKKNGRHNGGGYWNLAELADKYLDPNVKEGFTIGEPKAKSTPSKTPSKTPAKKTDAKKVVEKVAKKAANDAKVQMDLFGDLLK